ncbi:type II restriction endonuclease EcoO109I-like protein [Natranaerovirga hydrolytica]|uniref:Type II restriction endonuclease EcoO109I-like protein n=1 Tax=Natranaerovirga hydrolytica TaxID=680378 RepID=A0A4R1N3Z1_9FIRM|nr:PmeII family type II restriction endonuclease [Natranaerovirga hydrolytica]TCK98794.1 type II restriction endonuclease EcoO109I-like protein [Natranaerovirga hydrolytica]
MTERNNVQQGMSEVELNDIIKRAKDFFRNEIVPNHIARTEECRNLSNFRLNPFLDKYKATFITGNDEPRSIAKALVYPRVIGTSINTIFGNKLQKFCSEVLEGFASTTAGIDIEFIDKLDGIRKYCQVKASTNTINADDVQTIKGHFTGVRNLARTNNLNIGLNDLIVGVFYGDYDELSGHYKRIEQEHPVIVGAKFWHRLTGHANFYQRITDAIGDVALEYDGTELVKSVIDDLERQIAQALNPNNEE